MNTNHPNKERERKKRTDIINNTIILRQPYIFFFSQVYLE